MSSTRNVCTISSGTPFLGRLAQFVLDGQHIHQPTSEADPLTLSRTTIYLPTRRAVRTLRNEFTNQLGSKAALLPIMKTLGDSDDFEPGSVLPTDNNSDPLRSITPVTRQIIMARLIRQWVTMIGSQTRELFGDEDFAIPSSSAESLWLSTEITGLIDQMETEEISWDSLENLVADREEFASWWQLTLDFLQIAMKTWPEYLQHIGACDPATHRRILLDIRTKQLRQNATLEPVIAAGSTGSIPATARFLDAVSQLPNGTLILPGLDKHIDETAWKEISSDTGSNCEDHPQFGLSNLIISMGLARDEIPELGPVAPHLDDRAKLTSIAMLPSNQTDQWRPLMEQFPDQNLTQATDNISIIEAPAERQEALAIALVLRQQIENPKTHAALVTPDRNLARRVASELKRFKLDIDDSGGQSLASTNNAIFIRQLISVATQTPNALNIAALLKNPFLLPEYSSLAERQFEVCLLRDVLEIPAAGQFEAAITAFHQTIKNQRHLPSMVAAMDETDWQNLIEFCNKLDTGFQPLLQTGSQNNQQDLKLLFTQILESAHLLTHDPDKGSPLFADEAGLQLMTFFEELINADQNQFSCPLRELLPVFEALINGIAVRSTSVKHPRISIFGPLEARLQPLDCVILGGLNEGTWPTIHDTGPFLNRPMKTKMELATPERRTGLSAHDFEQLLGCPKVVLTRSSRVDNAPTVPSRWMQRLTAVCGNTVTEQMSTRGDQYLHWADLLDKPSAPSKRTRRPNPKPAIIHRPTTLSITEIETWIRDPYAIYAKRILKLLPLGKIGTLAEPAIRGTILHDAAADFVQNAIDPSSENAQQEFMALIKTHMLANKIPNHISVIWVPRFIEIAQGFIAFEQHQKDRIEQSFCEIDGKLSLPNSGFQLRGRADRIDVLKNGEVQIIDYKSGLKPTAAMARTLAPQLALEGAIVMAGGFADIGKAIPKTLKYVRMRARGEFKTDIIETKSIDAQLRSTMKLEELEHLVKAYTNPDQGYLSRFAVELADNIIADYDHLARVREWSLGGENEDAAGGDHD